MITYGQIIGKSVQMLTTRYDDSSCLPLLTPEALKCSKSRKITKSVYFLNPSEFTELTKSSG